MVKVMIGAIWRALSRIPGPFLTLRMQGFSELLQHEEPLPTRHRDGDQRLRYVYCAHDCHLPLSPSSSRVHYLLHPLRPDIHAQA